MEWIILWFVGTVATYLIAKYYDWDRFLDGHENPPIVVFAMFWFIAFPIILIMKLGSMMAELGRRDRAKKQELHSKRRGSSMR